MKQIQRIYLSGPVSRGVAESQMLNWAKLLEDEGVKTDFLVFYNIKNQNKFLKMKISEMGENFVGKKYNNVFPIRELTSFFIIFNHLRILNKKTHKLIIQTRSASFAIPILMLKLFFQFKIVYEIRGAGEEGMNKKNLTYFNNSINNWLLLKISDKIITVSRKLLEHKIRTNSTVKFENKSTVIYGAADSRFFNYNPELRAKKREELHINNRIVILYIGMLDKSWQIPDFIFKFVSNLMHRNNNLYFLVITPNIEVGNDYRKKYGIEESNILIREATQNNLNEYINASDFGLLLRENLLVNNVASPTKFSEYLLGGLPVIISEGIGDYSEFTETNNVGIVINTDSPDYDLISVEIAKDDFFLKNEIQKIGNSSFSKQGFIENLLDIYKTI